MSETEIKSDSWRGGEDNTESFSETEIHRFDDDGGAVSVGSKSCEEMEPEDQEEQEDEKQDALGDVGSMYPESDLYRALYAIQILAEHAKSVEKWTSDSDEVRSMVVRDYLLRIDEYMHRAYIESGLFDEVDES